MMQVRPLICATICRRLPAIFLCMSNLFTWLLPKQLS